MTLPQQPTQQAIHFIRQGTALTTSLIKTKFTLDGVPVPTGFGENFLPVPPGVHRLEAVGQSHVDVEVPPGQLIDVYFAPGWTILNKGVFGPTEQQRPGLAAFITVMVVAVALVLGVMTFL